MKLVYVSLFILVCVVIEIKSERTRSGLCKGCHDYVRIKRAKYYSNPPLRFYNRPPMSYPIKGAFSFTPPPGYQMDDRQPPGSKPKVSSYRQTNEGLGDEDVNNIMRFLSKQDLDKIVEFANEKDRESPFLNKPNYVSNIGEKYKNIMYNGKDSELENDKRFQHHEPFARPQQDFRPYSFEYNNSINELKESNPFRHSGLGQSTLFVNQNQMMLNSQVVSDRIIQKQQIPNFNTYAYQDGNEIKNGAGRFSDSSLIQEELLPKPSNLRDDFEVSYTNNVPTFVKADSNSYEIENLGSLPLMNYHSKLESVDSYKVPHYTVTSPEKYGAIANSEKIPVEPAPPVSSAKEQSDAHLKATKIWTHKSKGTAYTLHDDGTLSLERPTRSHKNYGHS